jgi:hypothetical protein
MPFPTTPECIALAEAALQTHLPAPWRERLLRMNGGECILGGEGWQLFPVQDTTDRKRAGRTASHIVQETTAAREWRGFPEGGVAIAGNGSGDYLVLLPESAVPGPLAHRVYRWDHETADLTDIGACADFE